MNKPTIDLYVTNGQVQFRFYRIRSPKFHDYLRAYKVGLPRMYWRTQFQRWEIPIEQFQPLYELSRLVFGVENIKLHFLDYSPKTSPLQLSLFDKDR